MYVRNSRVGGHTSTRTSAVPMIPFSCLDWQVTIRLRSYAFLRGFLGVTWKEMFADFPGSMVLAVESGGLFNNTHSKQV